VSIAWRSRAYPVAQQLPTIGRPEPVSAKKKLATSVGRRSAAPAGRSAARTRWGGTPFARAGAPCQRRRRRRTRRPPSPVVSVVPEPADHRNRNLRRSSDGDQQGRHRRASPRFNRGVDPHRRVAGQDRRPSVPHRASHLQGGGRAAEGHLAKAKAAEVNAALRGNELVRGRRQSARGRPRCRRRRTIRRGGRDQARLDDALARYLAADGGVALRRQRSEVRVHSGAPPSEIIGLYRSLATVATAAGDSSRLRRS
jgi:hypothetical protein